MTALKMLAKEGYMTPKQHQVCSADHNRLRLGQGQENHRRLKETHGRGIGIADKCNQERSGAAVAEDVVFLACRGMRLRRDLDQDREDRGRQEGRKKGRGVDLQGSGNRPRTPFT